MLARYYAADAITLRAMPLLCYALLIIASADVDFITPFRAIIDAA